ncbi:MAG: UvrD-helicase domain-containing protein [Clostridia bacterium]|nr:UvrD-helicase domain-containing protein [Clostridia bacterium]
MSLLDGLNNMQREAAERIDGPLLVLAGAGSGKTRVLTYRIAHMIEEGIKPWNILAITFTNKAAKEMAERVEALIGDSANDMWVRTFHSACVRILRRDIDKLGFDKSFNIIDADDQKSLIKECLKELNLDDKIFTPKGVMAEISSAKDSLKLPPEYEKGVAGDYKKEKIARIYEIYQEKLRVSNCLDFDDLILQTVRLFMINRDVLEYYQNKFRYILVDEYQDTNNAQNILIMLLAKNHRNLCVVGDDDQSIYKFRGANIENILNFEKMFPDAHVVRLEQNYRSTQNILDAANSVIKNNLGRKGKNLWTDAGEGEKIIVHREPNEQEEAAFIASEIRRLYRDGYKYSDIAVLYRNNSLTRSLETIFMRDSIPYELVAGRKFYDRMEIRDMVAYLRLAKNPDDDMSLKRIINTPGRKIGKTTVDTIGETAYREGTSIFKSLQFHKDEIKTNLKEFVLLMEEIIDKKNTLSVDEFVNYVYEKTGYREHLEKDEKAEDRQANVGELISGAKNFCDTVPDATFDDYMDNIALVSDLDSYDEDAEVKDKCTLMTMHSAKGLEFPVVFILGVDEGVFPSFMSIYDESELEEERRLCYVGITRARKQLCITGAFSRMVYGKTSPYQKSRFLEEIPESVYEYSEKTPFGKGSTSGGFDDDYGFVNFERKPKLEATTLLPKKDSKVNLTGNLTFKVGDRVHHKKFGAGLITAREDVGNDVRYEIAFDSVGTKNLLGLYAKLEKEE